MLETTGGLDDLVATPALIVPLNWAHLAKGEITRRTYLCVHVNKRHENIFTRNDNQILYFNIQYIGWYINVNCYWMV